MSQVKSFDLILSLLDEEYFRTRGNWFFIPESEVIKIKQNRQFGFHPGARRVLFWRSSGPNAIVFPRTTSGDYGLVHTQHLHEEFSCRIDRPGRIVSNCPCTVKAELFNNSTYSCIESEETGLVDELERMELK